MINCEMSWARHYRTCGLDILLFVHVLHSVARPAQPPERLADLRRGTVSTVPADEASGLASTWAVLSSRQAPLALAPKQSDGTALQLIS